MSVDEDNLRKNYGLNSKESKLIKKLARVFYYLNPGYFFNIF